MRTFRSRGISASVFQNETQANGRTVPYFKVQLQKTYKQGESYRTTSSFSRDEIPVAQLMLQRAWKFILEAEAKRSKDGLGH